MLLKSNHNLVKVKVKVFALIKFISPPLNPSIATPNSRLIFTAPATFLSNQTTLGENLQFRTESEELQIPNNAADVLKSWGCNEKHISKIFQRRPSLRSFDPINLHSKLKLLEKIGFSSEHLIKIVDCRPRFLNNCISKDLDERLSYLASLFDSKEQLCKVIIRNPSLLTYDLHTKIKPVVELYEEIGLSKKDLSLMLMCRPTLIPRTSLCDEKLEYIKKTGTKKGSKIFKYVVTIVGVSRLETIREKIANLERFGISEDEIFRLFGLSPLVFTLSVEKVERNMTYIVGDMKLPANVILSEPYLLFAKLETVLKPRIKLAGKIKDMGLVPEIKGSLMFTALRMTEERFVKAFIKCHPLEVAKELMEYYTYSKQVKRLAESSKKILQRGFPF